MDLIHCNDKIKHQRMNFLSRMVIDSITVWDLVTAILSVWLRTLRELLLECPK